MDSNLLIIQEGDKFKTLKGRPNFRFDQFPSARKNSGSDGFNFWWVEDGYFLITIFYSMSDQSPFFGPVSHFWGSVSHFYVMTMFHLVYLGWIKQEWTSDWSNTKDICYISKKNLILMKEMSDGGCREWRHTWCDGAIKHITVCVTITCYQDITILKIFFALKIAFTEIYRAPKLVKFLSWDSLALFQWALCKNDKTPTRRRLRIWKV